MSMNFQWAKCKKTQDNEYNLMVIFFFLFTMQIFSIIAST